MVLNYGLLLKFLLQERPLAILDFKVDPQELKIVVTAGTDGFWGWIMRCCGLDTKSGFLVDSTGCRRTASSLLRRSQIYAPHFNISTAVYYLVKPIWALFVGLYFAYLTVSGLWNGFGQLPAALEILNVIFLVMFGAIAVFCLLKFFLGDRSAAIGVMTNASSIVSIRLKVKPSDLRKFQQAIAILEILVARANGAEVSPEFLLQASDEEEHNLDDMDALEDEAHDEQPARRIPTRPQNDDGKRVIQCPHCDAKLRLNASILGSRIRCPACQEPFVAR